MKLTLGTTYYNNPEYLEYFVMDNLPYVDEMIIVDDGSKPQLTITKYLQPTDKIKIFRVKKDYGFNSHGCRNLIMKMTSNPWVILMDIDRKFMFIQEDFKTIRSARLDPKKIHRFVAHGGKEDSHVSVNDFLIHRDFFFSAGGYDEELIGLRTGDRQYFEQLAHFGGENLLHGVNIKLTRRASMRIGGRAISPLDRKYTREDVELLRRRIANPEPNKPILTFEWEEITAQPQS